jgi:hypothetical protein
MLRFVLTWLLAGIALSSAATRRVTVEQFEEALVRAHGNSDATVARQLSELELTERLSAATRSRLEVELPGPQSRQVLVGLADMSAFLDLPAAEIPANAAPDIATQRGIMALAVDYVGKSIPKLPNFFATRVTNAYQNTVPTPPRLGESPQFYMPLHFTRTSAAVVLYRDGREVVDSSESKGRRMAGPAGLATVGTFGPILLTVLMDAAAGELAWSHWEQGTSGLQAVFRYSVPLESSHYDVTFFGFEPDNETRDFQKISAYHGEIAVNPESGAILRVTLQADLLATHPLAKADILVEYGQVELGGKSYICPVKSISLSVMRAHRDTLRPTSMPQISINDVAFEQYHLFRADVRVLGPNGQPLVNVP